MNPLSRLRSAMAEKGLSALFVSNITNINWLSGFTGSSAVCIVTPDQAIFITDSRYTIQADAEVQGLEVRWFAAPKNQDAMVAEVFSELGLKEICFDTSASFSQVQTWKSTHDSLEWSPVSGLIEELRKIKAPAEIEKVRRACQLSDSCMEHITRLFQPGVRELDILIEIEFFYRRQGAIISFEPIVASGPNSALPHGRPTERKLEVGDFLTIDMGARLDGYCSDITRTFVIGEATDRHRLIYNSVLNAQLAALDAIRPGVTGIEVDAAARRVLGESELDQYFGHGLGHGLGLAVHDPGGLSPRSTDTCAPGQIWTVEPGVYIAGFGGVRIEDDVVVTENGIENLTKFPKELTILP